MNLSDKKVLIYDNGLFCELAVTIAPYFAKIYYYTPWKSAFPSSNATLVGKNIHPKVERINNFWDVWQNADLFIFPDVYDGDLQKYLRSLGKRVWGSGKGEELELYRWETKQYFKKIGLAVQPTIKVIGLDALREHLKKHTDKYIKTSTYRRDFETFAHIKYSLTEPILDDLELRLGAKKHIYEFIVEDAIKGDDVVEVAYDGYSIDGEFPESAIFGYEIKDCGYLGTVKKYKDLSPIITNVNKKLAPALKKYQYRNFFAPEMRVGKDKIPYVIDPCARFGSPPNELYQEMFDNLHEIFWYGAEGKLITPKWRAKFGLEVLIHSSWADTHWQAIDMPKDIRRWVKLRNFTVINGKTYVVPQSVNLPEIGAVISIGNTIDECVKKIKQYAEKIEGYSIHIKLDSIDNAIEATKVGEKLGIKF